MTPPLVTVTQLDDHQGQPSHRIETPGGTWVYHMTGAGFASLLDPDGADWLSYRPGGGPAGEYRGIPNVIHPEGGFHPGATTGVTELVEAEWDRAVLASTAWDGAWACRWEIVAAHAVLTLERVDHPYWFLYEGTPGGDYDETSAWHVDTAGRRDPCTARWERRLPDSRAIAFATPGSRWALALADLTPRDPGVTDSFWSMEQSMTVFGFGRSLDSQGDRWMHLTETPATFKVGFLGSGEPDDLAGRLRAWAEADA